MSASIASLEAAISYAVLAKEFTPEMAKRAREALHDMERAKDAAEKRAADLQRVVADLLAATPPHHHAIAEHAESWCQECKAKAAARALLARPSAADQGGEAGK